MRTHLAMHLTVTIAALGFAAATAFSHGDPLPPRLGELWTISDRDFCASIDPDPKHKHDHDHDSQLGMVESVYRSISRSVPHSDAFYPSCSRFISEAIDRYSILGWFVGLGRFSRSHLPIIHPDYPAVVVAGEVRLYDPLVPLETSNLRNHGFSSYPVFTTKCSESRQVHQRFTHDGRPDPAWRL